MRRLAVYLKNYKKESILAPFFKFLEVVFDLLVPVVIARMIDVGIAGNNREVIIQNFFILLLMAAAGLTVSITAQFFAAKASTGFAAELRQAVFDHVQSFSFSQLDRLGTDTLITRLTDDINQVQNGLNMGLRLLLRSPFYCPWFHGHGLYCQCALRPDFCCSHSCTFSGRLSHYVSQHPPVSESTGET